MSFLVKFQLISLLNIFYCRYLFRIIYKIRFQKVVYELIFGIMFYGDFDEYFNYGWLIKFKKLIQ